MEDDGSSYLFSGSVIYRSDQDVTVLRKAVITSGTDDNRYWSINSSRLWLLPGSDFAILNALLKVGEIPVLYIPFFYFPGDEIVFHPVVGYRSREGGFVQTTTYLIGQPKADSSEKSSLSRIIGNSDKNEKELQGLFLRNTSKPRKNPNSPTLKALVDYYVNLGTFAGLELNTPTIGVLNPLTLNLGFGFTRTVSETDFGYSPYAPNYNGDFEINESNFLSKNVPFRYRMKFASGFTGKYGGLSWDIPYYSDPYVDRDFTKRAESMDWMNMIQQGAAIEDSTSLESEISSYTWQMTGSFNPSLSILSPVITNFNISSIYTTLTFKNMNDFVIGEKNIYSPNRYFYAPDKYVIYSISGAISGTPITVGGSQPKQVKSSSQNTEDSVNDPFSGIGVPISPWTKDETNGQKTTSTEILTPPVLSQTFALPDAAGSKFSVDYSIAPTSSSELQFMNQTKDGQQRWKTYEDVDWNERQSILGSVGGNTNLNFHIDHMSGFYTNTITLTGSGKWLEYSYLNEEMYTDPVTGVVNEDDMEKKRREQYSQTNYTTSYSYNGTIKPFYTNPIFAQTNFQYTFRGTLVKSKKFSDGDGPELSPLWGSWVKEELGKDIPGLNAHRFTTNFVANILEKDQNISASAELPPLDGLITANATFRVWITETYGNFRMEKPETEGEWKIRPFDVRETLKFGTLGSFSHNMVFTPDEDYQITNIRSTLTLWRFKADYSMIWTKKSFFDPYNPDNPVEGGVWKTEGDNALRPKDLIFSFNNTFPSTKLFNYRFSLSYNINTSLNFDLQQHTNSNFQFSTGVTMGINKFMDLTISASSQNAVIFRYFKGAKGMEDLTVMYTEGEQNNVFIDLIDSFNFFDESKRRRSGFKMQRFDLTLEHFLGDWTASFKINMYPYQRAAKMGDIPTINIVSDISFLLQWKPITEIKSDVSYDGKNDRWTRK